ncbi:MAG TPA: hypothetical protein VJA40_04535 [archaeon]|nr:hypothetical protein [archaeon]
MTAYSQVNSHSLRQLVHEEVQKAFREKKIAGFYKLSDSLAESAISSFILTRKAAGEKTVSVPQISFALGIPVGQVDLIIEKFEKAGRLREVNDQGNNATR